MSKSVFVDIDTQFDFMHPEGHLYVPGAETLIPQLERLMQHARTRGIPVVASADAHAGDDPEFQQFPAHCVQGTAGQEKIDVTHRADALVLPNQPADAALEGKSAFVLEKTVFDLFGNPNAERVFASLAPQQCYVFGVATDYCVRAAALGLRQRGYAVTVVSDAIRAVTAAGEAHTLDELTAAGIRLLGTDQVLTEAQA